MKPETFDQTHVIPAQPDTWAVYNETNAVDSTMTSYRRVHAWVIRDNVSAQGLVLADTTKPLSGLVFAGSYPGFTDYTDKVFARG